MGWEMPWYTITDGFDADFGVDEWHGTNAFIRDGDRVFRTYFVNSRGDEAMGSTWSYLDITALGRQEEWEDSPEGYPQTPPYEWWNWHDEYSDRRAGPGLGRPAQRRGRRGPAGARRSSGQARRAAGAGHRVRIACIMCAMRTDISTLAPWPSASRRRGPGGPPDGRRARAVPAGPVLVPAVGGGRRPAGQRGAGDAAHVGHVLVLEAIDAAGAAPATGAGLAAAIADVAVQLGLDRSNASRMLASAVAAGLVTKTTSPRRRPPHRAGHHAGGPGPAGRRPGLAGPGVRPARRRLAARPTPAAWRATSSAWPRSPPTQPPRTRTRRPPMTIILNHTIVPVADAQRGAQFLADLLGLPVSPPAGPFVPVRINDDLTFDFDARLGARAGHYAFLVDDAIFDRALGLAEGSDLAWGPRRAWPTGRSTTSAAAAACTSATPTASPTSCSPRCPEAEPGRALA